MSFAALLAAPGVEEVLEVRGRFGFLAFHGGALERLTDVVARAAAARAGASCYSVLMPEDNRQHLPSTSVVPEASPRLAAFLDHVEVVIAVHGYGRHGRWTSLLAGGSNRLLAAHVADAVHAVLPGYEVVTDLADIPPELRGLHSRNPVNRPPGGGVQLELPPRVRGMGPTWAEFREANPGALTPATRHLIAGLVAAASSWPVAGAGVAAIAG